MSTPGNAPDRTRSLRLVHHHPGRIRMRADAFIDAHELATRVMQALGAIPGVRDSAHRPRTGSVLVTYTPGIVEPDAILAVAAEIAGLEGIIDEMLEGRPPVDAAGIVIDAVRGVDRVTRELTGGRANLPLLVPTALAGAAVYSLVKDMNGPRFPRWDNLAWWAYSAFLQWHRNEIERARTTPETDAT